MAIMELGIQGGEGLQQIVSGKSSYLSTARQNKKRKPSNGKKASVRSSSEEKEIEGPTAVAASKRSLST